jgi:hypothetical protein
MEDVLRDRRANPDESSRRKAGLVRPLSMVNAMRVSAASAALPTVESLRTFDLAPVGICCGIPPKVKACLEALASESQNDALNQID